MLRIASDQIVNESEMKTETVIALENFFLTELSDFAVDKIAFFVVQADVGQWRRALVSHEKPDNLKNQTAEGLNMSELE